MKSIGFLSLALAACHSGDGAARTSSRPAFTDALLAPAVKGLRVGTAKLDDITRAFPNATVTKDKSFGGTGTVIFNGASAISVQDDGLDASLITIDGAQVLTKIEVNGKGLCSWLVTAMDTLPGSRDCPGNRKTGNSGGEAVYCAAANARTVFVSCSGGDAGVDHLDYNLAKK